jgi:hypothetical protein
MRTADRIDQINVGLRLELAIIKVGEAVAAHPRQD